MKPSLSSGGSDRDGPLASVIRKEATKWNRQSLSHIGARVALPAIFVVPGLKVVQDYRNLERLDVGGLLALGAGRDVEADTLAFLQGLETAGVDC